MTIDPAQVPVVRLRSRVSDTELNAKIGKIITDSDYNLIATGPLRVLKPNGDPLCVYLPGILREVADQPEIYEILHSLRTITTNNRGRASGSQMVPSASGNRRSGMNIPSSVIGAVDPMGRQRYCRLTAWTGTNMPRWQQLRPLFQQVARHLAAAVPDRYANQMDQARKTQPEWIIPGTPFTTITVNNSYPTGVHTDKGDLDTGFSTIACLRRGTYTGGRLCFPRWRVAVDLHHGDLICMDAHEYHGNTTMVCECGDRMNGMCETCGAERISVVSYFRTEMANCGTASEELARARADADTRTDKRRQG